MKKLAIVGVEGSGKTVLLSAIGDKYERPDAAGVFMSPENQRAFGFVKLHTGALREGRWPAATTSNSNLDWSLYYKNGDSTEMICRLSLLDFAGEFYRLTFGDYTEDESAGYGEEIKVLQKHIEESDLLAVIVNLSDIINGSPLNARTRETMWVTKAVIDHAMRSSSPKEVAIVFSQADVYRHIIEECGGNAATLQKYMPHVASLYDKLPVFAVSSINKIIPSESGFPVPAPDFGSEGIDELMEWIVSKAPGYETLAARMREKRLASATLLQTAVDLQHCYTAECYGNTFRRQECAQKLLSTLQALRQANQEFPQYAQAVAELDGMEKEALEWLDFENKAAEIMKAVSAADVSQAESRLAYWVRNSEPFAARQNELRQEIVARQRELQNERRKRAIRRWLTLLFLLLVVIIALIAGYCWYLSAVVSVKASQGYAVRSVYGIQYAVWESGRSHPLNNELIAAEKEREWRCVKPGYVWAGNADIEWKPGEPHPENANLKAASQPGIWQALPGYVWKGGAVTLWEEGAGTNKYPHWVATAKEGEWRPEDGYKKESPSAPMLSALSWDTAWNNGSKRTTSEEGVWEHRHTCETCEGRKIIISTQECDACKGGGNHVVVVDGESCGECEGQGKVCSDSLCADCEGTGNISSMQACTRCDGKGRTPCSNSRCFYDGGTHLMMCARCSGNKRVNEGYGFVDCPSCGGQGIFTCRTCGGRGSLKCRKCTDGQVVFSAQCPACDGKGHPMVSCQACAGSGDRHILRDCILCTDGEISRENACPKCEGEGYVWSRELPLKA